MKKYRYIYPLSSAILSSLAISNELMSLGNSFIGFIAYVPLFFSYLNENDEREFTKTTLVYLALSNLLQNFWLSLFNDFGILIIIGVIVSYSLMGLCLAPIIFHSIKKFKREELLIPIFFTLFEYIKSIGYTAYPWGLSAYTIHNFNNLIQIVDFGGIFLLSFFVYFINVSIAFFIKNINKRTINLVITSISLVSLLYTYGLSKKLNFEEDAIKELDILGIQTNIDPWRGDAYKTAIEKSIKLTKEGLKEYPQSKLVIWSEGVLTLPFYSDFYNLFPYEESLFDFLKNTERNFIIGGPSYFLNEINRENFEKYSNYFPQVLKIDNNFSNFSKWFAHRTIEERGYNNFSNSLFLIDENLNILNSYSKIRLVIMAEFIPFSNYSLIRDIFNSFGINGWQAGRDVEIFNFNNINLAPLICFDDAFPILTKIYKKRGAELLLNLSNDSWSKTKSAEWQHFVVAKFRSIESNLKILRITNSGITSLINEFGESEKIIKPFEDSYIGLKLKINKTKETIYHKIGDLLIILMLVFLYKLILLNLLKR